MSSILFTSCIPSNRATCCEEVKYYSGIALTVSGIAMAIIAGVSGLGWISSSPFTPLQVMWMSIVLLTPGILCLTRSKRCGNLFKKQSKTSFEDSAAPVPLKKNVIFFVNTDYRKQLEGCALLKEKPLFVQNKDDKIAGNILDEVFNHLELSNLKNCLLVSKRWYTLAFDHPLRWRSVYSILEKAALHPKFITELNTLIAEDKKNGMLALWNLEKFHQEELIDFKPGEWPCDFFYAPGFFAYTLYQNDGRELSIRNERLIETSSVREHKYILFSLDDVTKSKYWLISKDEENYEIKGIGSDFTLSFSSTKITSFASYNDRFYLAQRDGSFAIIDQKGALIIRHMLSNENDPIQQIRTYKNKALTMTREGVVKRWDIGSNHLTFKSQEIQGSGRVHILAQRSNVFYGVIELTNGDNLFKWWKL